LHPWGHRGLRDTVESVLELLAAGITVDEMLAAEACLGFRAR
jgi:hypothetical protein